MKDPAAALMDYWASHWWELYAGALFLGAGTSVGIAAWSRGTRGHGRRGVLVRSLLYGGAGSMLAAITLTVAQHHDSPWESVCFLYDHLLGFFVDGSVVPLLIVALVAGRGILFRKGRWGDVWLDHRTIGAARLWVAVFYMACGVNKVLTRETLDFFHSSGYSTSFFFLIASWECGWGLVLAWGRAWVPAIVALSGDMAGAIYTHYHNYFSRGFPGPFENSLDALRMLLLLSYLAWALLQPAPQTGPDPDLVPG
jgi:hypothetical protein